MKSTRKQICALLLSTALCAAMLPATAVDCAAPAAAGTLGIWDEAALLAQPAPEAPALPVDMAETQPAPEAPALPADTAESQPAPEAPALPADTAETQPASEAPALPADTAEAQPAPEAPALPADTAETQPAPEAPALPADEQIIEEQEVPLAQAPACLTLEHVLVYGSVEYVETETISGMTVGETVDTAAFIREDDAQVVYTGGAQALSLEGETVVRLYYAFA